MNTIQKFIALIRTRTNENRQAMVALSHLPGKSIGTLREELDSLIRVIYLLSVEDVSERERLAALTLQNEKWYVITAKGKRQTITDKDMVELGNKLAGWTENVYKFGCAFIHLSNFHNYENENPFDSLGCV